MIEMPKSPKAALLLIFAGVGMIFLSSSVQFEIWKKFGMEMSRVPSGIVWFAQFLPAWLVYYVVIEPRLSRARIASGWLEPFEHIAETDVILLRLRLALLAPISMLGGALLSPFLPSLIRENAFVLLVAGVLVALIAIYCIRKLPYFKDKHWAKRYLSGLKQMGDKTAKPGPELPLLTTASLWMLRAIVSLAFAVMWLLVYAPVLPLEWFGVSARADAPSYLPLIQFGGAGFFVALGIGCALVPLRRFGDRLQIVRTALPSNPPLVATQEKIVEERRIESRKMLKFGLALIGFSILLIVILLLIPK